MKENLIFGYKWEDIQKMQQGAYQAPKLSNRIERPKATKEDETLLKENIYLLHIKTQK